MNALILILTLAASKGEKALDQGQFDRALKLLDTEVQAAGSDGEAARLLLLRAICFSAQDRKSDSESAMAAALTRDASATLPDDRASPELLQLFERARARVTGVLVVRTDEPASIRIDGVEWGPAPTKIMLPVGRHLIELVAADGRLAATEATVSSKAPIELKLELPPAPPPPPATKTASAAAPPRAPAVTEQPRIVITEVAPPQPSRAGPGVMIGAGVLLGAAAGAALGWSWKVAGDYSAGQQPGAMPTVSRVDAERVQTFYPFELAGACVGLALAFAGMLWLALR